MTFKWDDIPEARRESIERGVIAIRKINERETFHSWMQIGQSLDDAQKAAMGLANTNNPKGRAYNDAWNMIGQEVPDLININKTTRSHAVWMVKHREAVEQWHATLASNVQQEINHPTSVWRRYNKTYKAPTEPGKSEEPTLSQKKDASIRELQEKLDSANREIRQLKKGDDHYPPITRTATAQEILPVLKEFLGATKFRELCGLGLGTHKSTVKPI